MPLYFGAFMPLFLLAILWSVAIKGYALWTAARAQDKGWFIALLLINTLGILELVYLIWFSPKGSNKLNPAAPASSGSSPQE